MASRMSGGEEGEGRGGVEEAAWDFISKFTEREPRAEARLSVSQAERRVARMLSCLWVLLVGALFELFPCLCMEPLR